MSAVAAEARRQAQVVPSILSADFGRLREQVGEVLDAGAPAIHVDVMDAPELAARLAGAESCHLDPQLPEAVVLDSPFDVHGSPLWRAGAFVAQSRAAMLVARALAPRAGERVLDLCAAPATAAWRTRAARRRGHRG